MRDFWGRHGGPRTGCGLPKLNVKTKTRAMGQENENPLLFELFDIREYVDERQAKANEWLERVKKTRASRDVQEQRRATEALANYETFGLDMEPRNFETALRLALQLPTPSAYLFATELAEMDTVLAASTFERLIEEQHDLKPILTADMATGTWEWTCWKKRSMSPRHSIKLRASWRRFSTARMKRIRGCKQTLFIIWNARLNCGLTESHIGSILKSVIAWPSAGRMDGAPRETCTRRLKLRAASTVSVKSLCHSLLNTRRQDVQGIFAVVRPEPNCSARVRR